MTPIPRHVAAFRASAVDLAYISSLLVEAARMSREHASYTIDAAPDVQAMLSRSITDNLDSAVAATERALRTFREHAERLDEHYEDDETTSEVSV